MRKICQLISKYPLTAVCVAAIWYLSFFTPPHTKLDNVQFIDKWTHIVMYGGSCAVFWAEHLLRGRRSGDWLDLAANAVGVSLALGAAFLLARRQSRP